MHLVLQRLERRKEPVRVGGEVADGEALSVVAMLVDDTDAACRFGEDAEDTGFEEGDATGAVRLAAAEEDDGSAGLVELGVEPLLDPRGGRRSIVRREERRETREREENGRGGNCRSCGGRR